jgi:O-glycosyl hydrolase
MVRVMKRSRILGVGVVCLILMCGRWCRGDEHDDVVDLDVRHQVIDNFGASDAWTMKRLGAWSDENKQKVADLLFSTDRGIGLSLWRFNVGGGINHESIDMPSRTVETFEVSEGKYDWARQAGERWFARAAKDRGVPYLLAFVNSPPGRMTRNGLTNLGDDDASTTNLKPGMEKQYARYLCDILEHFREANEDERLVFDYVSPVNEPQMDWEAGDQEGNRASNEDIKRILLALHEELAARHLPVKIRAPESNTLPDLWQLDSRASKRWGADYGNYLAVLCGDPTYGGILDHSLSYHDYSSYRGMAMINDHQTLGEKMAQYPDCTLWMSEACFLSPERDLSMAWGLDIARLIYADLALANASAWEFWLAVSTEDYKDGLLYTDWHRSGDSEAIFASKAFWILGNYSRFIRPGMIRVELKGDKHGFDGLLGSAYLDPDTDKLVMVYINVRNLPETVTWAIKGVDLARTKLTPYLTSNEASLGPQPAIHADAMVEIPPRSVVTFVGKVERF